MPESLGVPDKPKAPIKNHTIDILQKKTAIFDDVWLLLHECFTIYLQVGFQISHVHPFSSHVFFSDQKTRTELRLSGVTKSNKGKNRQREWDQDLKDEGGIWSHLRFFKEFNGKILRFVLPGLFPIPFHGTGIFTYIGLFLIVKYGKCR